MDDGTAVARRRAHGRDGRGQVDGHRQPDRGRGGGRPLPAIRIGLAQIKGVGEELARAILWARQDGPYRSLADFCARVGRLAPLRHDAVAALVAAGAFDSFGIPRRRLLWLLDENWPNWQPSSPRSPLPSPAPADEEPGDGAVNLSSPAHEVGSVLPSPAHGREAAGEGHPGEGTAQLALPWEWPAERPADAPLLPPLTLEEEVAWDLATQGLSARPHPLSFRRRALDRLGALPIAALASEPAGRRVIVAGRVISAQRPPTAKGIGFLVLEDETGRIQAALPPALAETLRLILAESRLVAVAGRLECARWHRSLFATLIRPLPHEPPPARPRGEARSSREAGRAG